MSGSEVKQHEMGNDRYHEALMELILKINQSSFLKPTQMNKKDEVVNIHAQGDQASTLRDIGWVEKRQGIVFAEMSDYGGVFLKITAKAAGFVVGAKGSSIRAICAKTGAYTKSWLSCSAQQETLPLRIYIVEGSAKAIYETILIMLAAVERYTALVQGNFKDKKVSSEQIVEGIKFEYKPPPLTLMSNAARTIRNEPKPPTTGLQKSIEDGIPYLQERSNSDQLPFYYPQALPQSHLRYNQSLSPALQQRVAQIINYNNPYAAPALGPHPQSSPWNVAPLSPPHPYTPSPTMWYQSSPLPSPSPRGLPPVMQGTLQQNF